jgi:signal transduction histidine kinase
MAMAILIGIWETILALGVVISLTVSVLWWYCQRRLADLRRSLRQEHEEEIADLRQVSDTRVRTEIRDIVSAFRHQATHCLRPIKDSLHLLKKEVQGQTAEKSLTDSLATIERYEWRLTRLIENMRLVCGLEAPDERFGFGQVKLDAIVNDVEKEFQDSAETKGIQLLWWAVPETFPRIAANAESLRQVLINLVDNAIKYCGEGDEVDIALEAKEGQGVIYARVSDTGPGIPKEDWGHIFEKGYTVEQARGRPPKENGQGLGLYIAKLVAEKHGGSIDIASELGKGTTFTITLPVQRM